MSLDALVSQANHFLTKTYEQLSDCITEGVNKIADELNSSAEWIWGTLQGNWNPNQSTGQIVADAALGLVPIVGQVLDLRDLIACIYAFFDDEDDTPENQKWIMLILILVGFIPAAGDGIKALGKIVIANLRKYNGNLNKAIDPIIETIIEFLHDEKVIRVISSTNLEVMLQKIAHTLKEIAETLTPERILNVWRMQNRMLEELLSPGYKMMMPAGVSDFLENSLSLSEQLYLQAEKKLPEATNDTRQLLQKTAEKLSKQENTAKQAVNINENKKIPTKTHPPHLTKSAPKAPKKPLKCFTPNKEALDNAKKSGNYHKFEKEYYRQLKDQEAGINGLTAEEYLAGREAYKKYGRGSGSAQREVRESQIAKISKSLSKTYPPPMEDSTEVMEKYDKFIKEKATGIIGSLDALHNPDMVAGAKAADVTRLGNRSVNRSIGSQWKTGNRITEMDAYAKKIIAEQGKDVKMNVQLNRCK